MNYDYDIGKFKEIVIDTGPLLILLTGLYGHGVEKFVKEKEDFVILKEFVKNYSKIFVTPYVLAEVSNLAKKEFGVFFEDFIKCSINTFIMLNEEYVEKNILITKGELKLAKFGFTDASLIKIAMTGKLLLTTDIPLYWYCINIGIAAVTLDAIKKSFLSFKT